MFSLRVHNTYHRHTLCCSLKRQQFLIHKELGIARPLITREQNISIALVGDNSLNQVMDSLFFHEVDHERRIHYTMQSAFPPIKSDIDKHCMIASKRFLPHKHTLVQLEVEKGECIMLNNNMTQSIPEHVKEMRIGHKLVTFFRHETFDNKFKRTLSILQKKRTYDIIFASFGLNYAERTNNTHNSSLLGVHLEEFFRDHSQNLFFVDTFPQHYDSSDGTFQSSDEDKKCVCKSLSQDNWMWNYINRFPTERRVPMYAKLRPFHMFHTRVQRPFCDCLHYCYDPYLWLHFLTAFDDAILNVLQSRNKSAPFYGN